MRRSAHFERDVACRVETEIHFHLRRMTAVTLFVLSVEPSLETSIRNASKRAFARNFKEKNRGAI
jgi:hypothetical protein